MAAKEVEVSPPAVAARAQERRTLAAGSVLANRYRVITLLGRGGMGEVYRAEDMTLAQDVALKFLPEGSGGDADLLERLHAEVRNARQVSHPNVCRVYNIGESEGRHFIAMEYVDGEDLQSLLRRIGRLPPDKAEEIAYQLCAGLAAAHSVGVLHRDLKTSNVMIDGRGRARITDFGLAVRSEEASLGEPAGTPAFMAPEMLAGHPGSVQTDLYSLGLILYELFTGKNAFEPDPQTRKRPDSPTAPFPVRAGAGPCGGASHSALPAARSAPAAHIGVGNFG